MPKALTVLQPAYVAEFACIGSRCEDTCCAGGTVVIDRPTYEKYRGVTDAWLKPIIDRSIAVSSENLHDATFAIIVDSHLGCPFLTEEQLCGFQQRLGESFLSRVCSTFPRAINRVDGTFERSLYLSCPEAARLALTSARAMDRVERSVEWDTRLDGFPLLDSADSTRREKPFHAFHEVRAFIESLLRNRTYAVWERLMIIGIFCDQLNGMQAENLAADVSEQIAAYTRSVDAGAFRAALANVADQPAAQLRFLTTSIEHRLTSGGANRRFGECFQAFLAGVRYTPDSTFDEVVASYAAARTVYYTPFMAAHEHILENYLLNHTFRNLFPFGPQSGVYQEERSINDQFLLLVIQYAMMRSLLVGLAGHYAGDFQMSHVVTLIQSFAKSVEHDLPFLGRVLDSLGRNNMTNLAAIGVLLKD